METCTYAAPDSIRGIRRVFSVDRQYMAAGGCLARITLFGRCIELWGRQ